VKIILRLILVIVLIALGVWLWTVFFPSPQKIIRKNLLSLARDISFSAGENDLIKIADAQSVGNFFASNIVVNITIPGHEQESIMGPAEIIQGALILRQQSTDMEVKFPDINVTVAPDKNSATADATVEVNTATQHDAIIQEVKFTFAKVDGQWLITEVDTVRTLSQGPFTHWHAA
jgi:hypothetical protein